MINFFLFVVIWLTLEYFIYWKSVIKNYKKIMGYYFLLAIVIFIFEVFFWFYIIIQAPFFNYKLSKFIDNFQQYKDNPKLYAALFFTYVLIPVIFIIIRGKMQKNKKDHLRFMLLNYLIFIVAFVTAIFIWYYTWLVEYKMPFTI